MSDALERVTGILNAWRRMTPRPQPETAPDLLLAADPEVFEAVMGKLAPLGFVSLPVALAFASDYLQIAADEAEWFRAVFLALRDRSLRHSIKNA